MVKTNLRCGERELYLNGQGLFWREEGRFIQVPDDEPIETGEYLSAVDRFALYFVVTDGEINHNNIM